MNDSTKRLSRFSLLVALLLLSGPACTRLKPVETPTPAPTATPTEEPTPADFPSESPTPVPPTPIPPPVPKITIESPDLATDFSADAVTIAFKAELAEGRTVKSARVLVDGKELNVFTDIADTTSFRIERWNPNVVNNFSDPPDQTPLKTGEHTLTYEVIDSADVKGSLEAGFYKPLRITAWEEQAAMPNPTSHHAMFSDSAIPPNFVSLWGSIDGIDNNVIPRPNVYGFFPVGNGTWTTLNINGNSIPRAAYGAVLHPSGQLVYVIGGRTGQQDLRVLDIYAPLRKVAEQALVAMTTARSDATGAFVDDSLYAIGGRSAGTPIYSVERVKIGADGNPTGNFETRADMQNARAGANALVQGKEVWVFGGGHRPVEVYDTLSNTWRFLTDAAGTPVATPETWSNAAMVTVGQRVYFFGGEKEDGQALDRIFEFNPTTKVWRAMGPMPSITGEDPETRPLTRVAAFFHDGAFYLAGGKTLPGRVSSARVFRGPTL